MPSVPRAPHPLLYEINTRCWLRELSERHGALIDLRNVPDSEFARWQQLGFTHLWLMGVWTTGPRVREFSRRQWQRQSPGAGRTPDSSVEDILGSPYAIAGYRVSEALGGETGLAHFRLRLGVAGLKLVLDFIPNHFGFDHPWIEERPEFFVQSAGKRPGTFRQDTAHGTRWIANGRDPYFPPWADTAQLDYRNPATRKAMVGELRAIAGRCDGVRCDMAMLALSEVFDRTWEQFPTHWDPSGRQDRAATAAGTETNGVPVLESEFWSNAIHAIKGDRPDFLFLAEVYWDLESRLLDLGFDYAYDKKLTDHLLARRATDARRHLLATPKRCLPRLARFLENHDEARVAALLSLAEHRAAALVILGLPGLRLLHEGQLEGAATRASVHSSRRKVEAPRREVSDWYELALTKLQDTAVGRGESDLLEPHPAWRENPTARNLVVVQWQSVGSRFDLVVVNLAPHASQGYVRLSARGLADQDWVMTNLLGPERFVRTGAELTRQGLYLDLPPHGAQLFKLEPSRNV